MSGVNSGAVQGVLNAASVSGVVGEGNLSGSIGNGIAYVDGTTEPYTGQYDITPTVDGVTVPCEGKKMLKDMGIKAIPFYETSNDTGTTAYIASEVE